MDVPLPKFWLVEYETRLHLAVRDTNEELMSIVVKGLAETVRSAKSAIARASDAAYRLDGSARQLTSTLNQVESLTGEMDAANADLQAAVGTISNGDPNPGPLPGDEVVFKQATSVVTSVPAAEPMTIDAAIKTVEAANAGSAS